MAQWWLIRQNLRLSRKCVRWKAIFFGPKGMIGKDALGKRRFFFQELPPHAYFVRVRLGWSIQRLRGSRGVTQPARFQGSTRFYEAAHGYWSRIWTMNLWVYWIEGYLKWPSFFPSYNEKRKNHVETWNKKESTLGSHVMLLTCYKGLLNFPDRTGWGVSSRVGRKNQSRRTKSAGCGKYGGVHR